MTERMLAAIRCVDFLKRFDGREYGRAYKEYVQTYGAVYAEAVNAAAESEDGLNGLTEDLLNGLEAVWKKERFWNRSAAKANHKQMLVFYLSPMLLGLEVPGCAEFAELLRDGWAARWPRDAYQVADQKTIKKGFHNVILGVDLDRLRRPVDDDDENP
ncbi:MAG: hypothetical protein E7429_01920 [Ruminococcaceae bacterium]|nr:hypothetical protein [Oscillospiraceae bacterium]